MAISVYDIRDMVTATLFSEKGGKIANIDPNLLRNHVAMRRLLKEHKTIEQGGKAIRFDVNVAGDDDAADYVLAYQVEQVEVGDFISQGKDECRMLRTKFAFDETEEIFNKGKFAIVKHIKNREQNAKIAAVKRAEQTFWGETAYATRGRKPNGILNLLSYGTGAGSFQGTYSSGYSTVHDIDPTTNTGWKSFAGAYTNVTQTDLIASLKLAWAKTNFEAPLDTMDIPDYKDGNQMGLYTTLTVQQAFDNQLILRNDSLGDDVAWEDGRAKFKMTPITNVAALDSNARNPFIGINWGLLDHYVQEGWWWKPYVRPAPNQPLVVNSFLYWCHQIITTNRRELGFNFSTA